MSCHYYGTVYEEGDIRWGPVWRMSFNRLLSWSCSREGREGGASWWWAAKGDSEDETLGPEEEEEGW